MKLIDLLEKLEAISSVILNKKAATIHLVPATAEANHLMGVYLKEDNAILINNKLNKWNATLIHTLAHESKHSHQYQVITGDIPLFEVGDPVKWEVDFNNTNSIKADLLSDTKEFREFVLRDSEVDANAYAELFTLHFDNAIEFYHPDWYAPIIDERKKQLLNVLDFTPLKRFLINFKP